MPVGRRACRMCKSRCRSGLATPTAAACNTGVMSRTRGTKRRSWNWRPRSRISAITGGARGHPKYGRPIRAGNSQLFKHHQRPTAIQRHLSAAPGSKVAGAAPPQLLSHFIGARDRTSGFAIRTPRQNGLLSDSVRSFCLLLTLTQLWSDRLRQVCFFADVVAVGIWP